MKITMENTEKETDERTEKKRSWRVLRHTDLTCKV